MRAALERVLFQKPALRSTLPVAFGVLGNVFAGTFVFDITKTVSGAPTTRCGADGDD
jgi:hypothetical protein